MTTQRGRFPGAHILSLRHPDEDPQVSSDAVRRAAERSQIRQNTLDSIWGFQGVDLAQAYLDDLIEVNVQTVAAYQARLRAGELSPEAIAREEALADAREEALAEALEFVALAQEQAAAYAVSQAAYTAAVTLPAGSAGNSSV